MNHLPKRKQLLIVWSLMGAILVLFCMTGCGGGSGNTLKFGTLSNEIEGTGFGVSFPGYGGVCTSGCGIDNCLWPDSHKLVYADFVEEGRHNVVIACDTHFFGCDRCSLDSKWLGCTPGEKSTYFGYMEQSDENGTKRGCFYGATDGKETAFLPSEGSFGCVNSDGLAYSAVYMAEMALGIE